MRSEYDIDDCTPIIYVLGYITYIYSVSHREVYVRVLIVPL